MRTLDIAFPSLNSASYATPITALVVEPDAVGLETGVLLVSHGWGGNRRDYLPTMQYAAGELELLCLSVEFRGSGYDFDPVTGRGLVLPYDGSFYQLFDVLGGFRTVLALYPGVDRQRVFHYGGSQGGHLALLSAICAPDSFALVYATSPAVRFDAVRASWTGRSFEPWELSARDVVEHAERIRCPVVLKHGTADATLPVQTQTPVVEARLRELGKEAETTYIEGGGHGLEPGTTRLDRFKLVMPARAGTRRPAEPDDFAAGRIVETPCAGKTVRVDWSRPPDSVELVRVVSSGGRNEPGRRHAPGRASERRDGDEVLPASRARRSCRRRGGSAGIFAARGSGSRGPRAR